MNFKIFAIGLLAFVAVPSFAADLWNQTGGVVNDVDNGIPDDIFTDSSSYTSYLLSNVTVGAGGWHITSISEDFVFPYASEYNPSTLGSVEILAGGSSVPASNPTVLTTANLSMDFTGDYAVNYLGGQGYAIYEVTAAVNIDVSAGNYWIGMNPTGNFSNPNGTGEAYAIYTTVNSAGASYQDVWINPGGVQDGATTYQTLEVAAAAGTSPLYGTIEIQGGQPAPEPVTASLLGLGALSLVARRRRK